MDELVTQRLARLERQTRLWRVVTLVVLTVAVAGFGLRPLVAQQPRPGRSAMEYRQSRCLWPQMSTVLNEWEGKGWEAFQVVPIHPENPSVGGQMQVAVVFRRPSK